MLDRGRRMKSYTLAAITLASICLASAARGQSCTNLNISPSTLPDGAVGRSYLQMLTATGGTPPYVFGVKSGALPDGLRINADRITGTPTVAGSFSSTLIAIDSGTCTGTRAYNVNIVDPSATMCPQLFISPTSLPSATLGTSYAAHFTGGGGTAPYTFGLPQSGPPGLSLVNGTLSGSPNRTGVFDFDVSITDAKNCTNTQHFELEVLPPGCPANTTLVLSPMSGTAVDPTKPVTFSWTAVNGASRYDVLVSSDGGATYNTVASTADPTTLSAAAPLGVGSYLASVRTIFNATCSTRSALTQFSVGSAGCGTIPPTLNGPAAGSRLTDPSVLFQWSAVPDATSYEVFTSVNGAAFTSIANTSDTSATRIVPVGTIDWYVQADFATCNPLKSSISRFTTSSTNCSGGTVSVVSPPNGSTASSPVTFLWNAVPSATAYRIWFSVDGAPPTILARVTTTTVTLPVPSGAADWYVEALFDSCPSIVSPHNQFTVQRSANCGTAAPALAAPINTDVTTPVTFKWSAATGAVEYHLWYAIAGDALTDGGLTTALQVQRDLAPGTYSWFVEAVYSGCPSVPSATASFRVPDTGTNCRGAAPMVLAPSNGAMSVASPVTFSWTTVPGATNYRVFASINGGTVQLVGRTNDATLKKAIPQGSVVWFVEAAFNGCAATHSPLARFTVPPASNCPKTKPQLLTPADGDANVTTPVTLSWSPVSGATSYVVVARPARGAATVIGETTLTQLQRDVPAGTIDWWVIALGSGCDGLVSASRSFTVPTPPGCTSRRPHPLAPADDSVDVASPVHFAWTKSARATSYRLFAALDGDDPAPVATTSSNEISVPMPSGHIRWFVEAVFDSCPALFSAMNDVTVAAAASCSPPSRPVAHVAAQVLSATEYNVRWTGVTNASVYELQESSSANFANATTITVTGVNWMTTHTATTAPVPYFYRVRAVSACSDDKSPYSKVVGIRIIPPNAAATRNRVSAEVGAQNTVTQTVTIPATFAGQTFTARADKPWITITPSSGVVPSGGLTLTVTSDPNALNVGTNHAAIHITYSSAGSTGRIETDGNTTSTVPVSISLVTPVAPDTKASPPPDSLIIPAVGHGPGANASQFQSDIRLANVSSQPMSYLLNFTPTATDGTQTGNTTTIQVDPGATTALDDILATFFGAASDGSSSGMLEIRPLTTTSSSSLFSNVPNNVLASVASSRTYNVTANGTFGQFIPAIPFSQFVGRGSILSLQQIAQSASYRTNFGLLEAAGEPASVVIHVFDKTGNDIADIPESLLPSEHLALNGLLVANNIALDDGRVEIEVTSATGKVSGYASVLDNRTNDPLLVSPVLKGSVNSTRYVIPGVAYTNSIANWRTDARLYNSGSSAVTATLTYYPQAGSSDSTPLIRTTTIASGETKDLDNILNATFGVTAPNAGGSVLVTTAATSSIIASARTYAVASNGGTIGQFVPAVTPNDSVGVGDRALQLLQLEQSDAFRTNIGLAETTGSTVTAEVSLVLPDSKVTPVITVPLAPNQFTQLSLAAFGLTDPVYNARVSVKAVDGDGKLTAYGSLIDNVSQDPTYVPAQ